jgi:gamma-glutamylcyclotransferase (GGCT)/AIG2-like uncharacterized protein YtfP
MTNPGYQPQTREEPSMTRPLPFFVYGTLRPGMGNDWLWRDQADPIFDGEAKVIGHKLVGGGIPYLVPAVMSQVVGTILLPRKGAYERVLAEMDALESEGTHYVRRPIAVLCPGNVVRCWTYKAGPWYANGGRDLTDLPLVDGVYDYRNYRAEWSRR